jgi:hypothetical protein
MQRFINNKMSLAPRNSWGIYFLMQGKKNHATKETRRLTRTKEEGSLVLHAGCCVAGSQWLGANPK